MNRTNGTLTLGRKELVAKLAAIINHLTHSRRADESVQPTVHRISAFITACGTEFDLSNDEQLLFLKFIVHGSESSEELLKGENDDQATQEVHRPPPPQESGG